MGDVQTIYIRKGTPPRLIAVGRMCVRCRTVEPWNVAGLELADRIARGAEGVQGDLFVRVAGDLSTEAEVGWTSGIAKQASQTQDVR